MDIRTARESDTEAIMRLVAQAQRFMAQNGLDQWQDGYPQRERIEQDIAQKIGYVVCENENPVAYFAVLLCDEPDYHEIYEGEWKTAGEYATIHRAAVSDAARGKGLASRIFSFALEHAKQNDQKSLRIDTHEQNAPMRHAIAKFGFEQRGVIYVEGDAQTGLRRVAYEKAI